MIKAGLLAGLVGLGLVANAPQIDEEENWYKFFVSWATTPATQFLIEQHEQEEITYITKEQAMAIALEHAGLEVEMISKFEIEFDFDKGRAEYELEWDVDDTEYECKVEALTGCVYNFEVEVED